MCLWTLVIEKGTYYVLFYEDNRDNDDVNVGDGDPWPTKRSAIIGA